MVSEELKIYVSTVSDGESSQTRISDVSCFSSDLFVLVSGDELRKESEVSGL